MNFKLFSLFFFFVFIGFVESNAQMIGATSIDGTIKNAPSKMLYLSELSTEQMIVIDSAIINADNSFSFRTQIKKANFFQLSFKQNTYTILILEPEEILYIDLDANQLIRPLKIQGSYNTELVYTMISNTSSYDLALDSINNYYSSLTPPATKGKNDPVDVKQMERNQVLKDSLGPILIARYQQINDQKLEYIRSEIMSKPCLASLLFVDKLNIDADFKCYMVLDKALSSKYPDNYFVKEIHNKVQKKMLLAPGQPAPEIKMYSPDDKEIKLSSLRGNVVLIDFWASWCSPCRKANPDVVKLYTKYHSKGFEILGVSLDKTKSEWVKAIKEDNLNWLHVSDLLYWKSIAAKNYGVDAIPFTVLVDRQGNVIATGLRDAELENKLKEIFGE